MATVSILLRTDRVNKKGEAPINFLVFKDGKLSKIATGIKVPIKFWDEEKHKVRKGFRNSSRINSLIWNKYTELNDEVLKLEDTHKSVTVHQLKEKIYGKKPTDFFVFADEVVQQYLSAGQIGSYDKNRSIIAKLKEYHYGKQLMFQDITPSFLIKYERHLREVHDNTTNTINKDMKFIRKIFNDAYRLDIIEHNQNPFLKYKMKLEKTQRTFLTEEELKLIEDFQTSPGSRLEMHRDMFVFASYTGLRVSDVLQLRWKNFDGTHIHFTMKKTGQQLSIKLPNVANEIIRRYSPNKNSPGQFIFPALPEDFDMKDLRRLDTEISRATAYVNKNLKIIAQRVGIDKNLSFHVGRHTFATRAIAKDIPIQIVMSTMGHTNPRETLIYAKILNAARDKAMDAFND